MTWQNLNLAELHNIFQSRIETWFIGNHDSGRFSELKILNRINPDICAMRSLPLGVSTSLEISKMSNCYESNFRKPGTKTVWNHRNNGSNRRPHPQLFPGGRKIFIPRPLSSQSLPSQKLIVQKDFPTPGFFPQERGIEFFCLPGSDKWIINNGHGGIVHCLNRGWQLSHYN